MKKGRRREREVGRRKTSQCSVQNGKVKGVSACLPTTIPPLITSASSSGVVDCAVLLLLLLLVLTLLTLSLILKVVIFKRKKNVFHDQTSGQIFE